MRDYKVNAESARQVGASSYISETGKYKGRFTRAEAIQSEKGTEGIEFTFESDSGQTADYLTCWTYNPDGKELYGMKVLSAVMTCMRTKEIKPDEDGSVKDKSGAQRAAILFPDLMGKSIGLLLQKEEYIKRDGSSGYKFNIFAPFEASTELTAAEILDQKTSAEQLPRMVAGLTDRKPQNKPIGGGMANAQAAYGGVADGNRAAQEAAWDDGSDIPF